MTYEITRYDLWSCLTYWHMMIHDFWELSWLMDVGWRFNVMTGWNKLYIYDSSTAMHKTVMSQVRLKILEELQNDAKGSATEECVTFIHFLRTRLLYLFSIILSNHPLELIGVFTFTQSWSDSHTTQPSPNKESSGRCARWREMSKTQPGSTLLFVYCLTFWGWLESLLKIHLDTLFHLMELGDAFLVDWKQNKGIVDCRLDVHIIPSFCIRFSEKLRDFERVEFHGIINHVVNNQPTRK